MVNSGPALRPVGQRAVIVGQFQSFLVAVYSNNCQYRAEDLLFIDPHARLNVVEQRWANKVAVVVIYNFEVEHNARTVQRSDYDRFYQESDVCHLR